MSDPEFDTVFALPAVDDPATVEVGVVLLGLDAERLLAGLGVTALADDAAMVTLLVDQIRHGAPAGITMADVVAAGARRWLSARAALAAADPGGPAPAALRQTWARTLDAVSAAEFAGLGGASRAYLTACWLRRAEVDRHVEELSCPT